MNSVRAKTWNYSTRLFSTRELARSQGHRIPGLLSGGKKKRKKTQRCEKWRTRCKYIRFTAKSTGRKCAEGQSPSATGDHIHTYTHKDGIQGGGELPGRDLRLGHHLPEWPWLASSLPLLPSSILPTFVSLIDATRARVARNICGSTIDHARPHRRLDYDSRELHARREYNTFKTKWRCLIYCNLFAVKRLFFKS